MATEIQRALLNALCNKIAEIDNPDPDVIRNLSYRWSLTNLKDIGNIPKITFEPYGRDTRIKAEIMRNAGLRPSDEWKQKREQIRRERADQQNNASQSTMKQWGLEVGADYMLQGSINSIMDAYKRKKVIYYQIDMMLTNIETNEVVWIGDKKIKKFVKN